MPAYELSVVLKQLPRIDLAAALKRIGTVLLNEKCVISKIENHGTKSLPYRMNRRLENHYVGSYFVFHFMASPYELDTIKKECRIDIDILQSGVTRRPEEFTEKCTLEEELKPPVERESVQKMLEAGKKAKITSKPFNKYYKEYDYSDVYQ